MKKFHAAVLALSILPIAGAARAEGVDLTLTIDAQSDRVFRGILINDDPVLQPGFTLGWRGMSFSGWGSMDMTDFGDGKGVGKGAYGDREMDFQEANFTLAYDHDFGTFAVGGGCMHREYPGQTFESTQECFARMRVDTPVVVSLEIVRDVGEAGGWYSSLGLGHAFQVGARTHLDLSAGMGWGDRNMGEHYFGVREHGAQDARLTLGVRHQVSGVIEWRGWAEYTEIVDGDFAKMTRDEDHLVVGSGGTFRF